MVGTIINSIAIIVGCIIGLFIKGGISKKLSENIMNALALCVLYIGISGSLQGDKTIITIVSMACGALIGELIDIDKALNKLGDNIEKKFNKNNKEGEKVLISQGFISASLIFCVGAMAIVGPLESGLQGNNETLYVKSLLDGITSIIFTATLGIGVMLSSVSVFIYQGTIALGATFLSGVLNDVVINCMTSIGSLLIMGLGLNMLNATKIKVANLLPAIFFPIIFYILGVI